MLLAVCLWLAGAFTLVLGLLHFALPELLDYKSVILDRPAGWKPLRALRLWPTRYVVTLRDRLGSVWVMNHAASYALVSIGLLDLLAQGWLRSAGGHFVLLWIAGWWFVRAATQGAFGRRLGDWLILAWFAALGALHLWAFFA